MYKSYVYLMSSSKAITKIEITTLTIIKSVCILVGLYFVWQLKAVFFMLFFAFILYSAFNPVVNKLQKRNLPRWFAIFCIYLMLFIIISFITVLGANVLIGQVQALSKDLDSIIISFLQALERIFPWLQNQVDYNDFVQSLSSEGFHNILSSRNLFSAFGVLSSVGSVALAAFAVIMVSVYMLGRKEKFYLGIIKYFPKNHHQDLAKLMKKIEVGLGSWFVGELILMLSVGFFTGVGVALPGLFFDSYTLDEYALPIALIAGLLEALPNLGPTITVIISAIIAIGSGDLTTAESTVTTLAQASYVSGLGLLIQNLEAVFLVPAVMKKVVGVDPIVTILAIVGALGLFGIIGALIIVPIITTVQIIIDFYRENNAVRKTSGT